MPQANPGLGDAIPLGLCECGGVGGGARGVAMDPERCSGLVYGVPTEREARGGEGTQSGALGWYTAFLQNAGRGAVRGPGAMLWAGIRRSYRTRVVGVVGDPERCSGLVYGVPTERGATGGGGTQSGALCYCVGNRGCRECFAGPPGIHRSSLRDGAGAGGIRDGGLDPERCFGLVYGVPLGHGVGVWGLVRGRVRRGCGCVWGLWSGGG